MRQRRAERDIEQISEGDGGLGRLLATARALERLDAHLQSTLPARLRGQVKLACIEGKTLVLAASSPAWASRARLLADDMLREANRRLDEPLTSTRVIVVPKIG